MDKNTKTLLFVLGIVAGMIALSFASVPLYRLFCQVTGFAGTTQVGGALPTNVLERKITIRFNADTSPDLPWDFKPETPKITLQVGQQGLVSFSAKNRSHKPTAGTALYNVTPLKAGKYFHKIQCFCFDKQILRPDEKMPMPVLFFVDPDIDNDRDMDDVNNITLSYTFFPANSKTLDQALEKFYETPAPSEP